MATATLTKRHQGTSAAIRTQPRTNGRVPRPQTEAALRELAFVLKLTAQVKQEMLQDVCRH
jgi:hypothetical protein